MDFNWKGTGFLGLTIILWHFSSIYLIANETLFPPPLKVLEALIEWHSSGKLVTDFLASIWRLALGLSIGSAIGTAAGLVMGRALFLEETVAPVLHILRALPPVAIIPLIIIWLGIGDEAKIFTIAFGSFFPVWLSLLIGTKSIPHDYIKIAKIFSKSKFETYAKVILPATRPFLMNGVRIGIAVAFILVFVSELAGASQGLGYVIADAQITYRTDLMIAGLIVLGLTAFATDYLFTEFCRRSVHWTKV